MSFNQVKKWNMQWVETLKEALCCFAKIYYNFYCVKNDWNPSVFIED